MRLKNRMSSLVARCQLFLVQLNLHSLRKLAIALAGGSVVLVGIAMLALPGPAIVVIPLGLAILATEFLWARRWLKRAKVGDPFARRQHNGRETVPVGSENSIAY